MHSNTIAQSQQSAYKRRKGDVESQEVTESQGGKVNMDLLEKIQMDLNSDDQELKVFHASKTSVHKHGHKK